MADVVVVSSDLSKQRTLENLNSGGLNGESKRHDSGIKCQVDLGSGNTECCVLNCSTNFPGAINKSQVTFVTFPKDPSRFTEWTRAIGRQDLLCYIGKKEATNLLVCSKHFSEDMWVNSNTRLKRLHKSAVPEISSDEEVDVLEVNPAIERIHTSPKKSGLKIKKVSSLLTESALKETLSSSVMDMPVSILTGSAIESLNNKTISMRKWSPILHRPKQTGSTELEKKLLLENGQLKAELDKNMDYILNQKAHYEGILSKEKRRNEELESKIEVLENAQRKLWHTYESQLQAQRTVVNTKEVGRKEMMTRMKHLENTNDSLEKKLAEVYKKVADLQMANRSLEVRNEELSREELPLLPPPAQDFTGEHFRAFLNQYLRREKFLREKVEGLTTELETQQTSEGQETLLLNLAARRLNHMQLSWLEVVLKGEDAATEFQEHLKELCLSLYEASEDAYAVFTKTLGMPPLAAVRAWAREPLGAGMSTANSTINALFEEGEPVPKSVTSGLEKQFGKLRSRLGRERSPPLKKKRLTDDEDDDEEGRASDEEEEVVFSEDSEEDDEEESEVGKERENEKSGDPLQQDFEVGVTTATTTTSSSSLAAETPQPDFDFILEEEEVTTQHDEDDASSAQVGSSMPMLVPDSSLTPISSLGEAPQPPSAPSEPKISSRKKVITSDSSLPSGSKVVFRVIES